MLTEEERLARIGGLGASDSPIIMGYSSYKTPYELFLEKTGQVSLDDEMTELQYWGNALEPAILNRFSQENGLEVTRRGTVHHPDYPFIFANLDGWIESEKAVVEAKCVNIFQRREWDMSLEDGIPMNYLIQIAKQCMITDASRGYCAVLVGGMEYRQFIYERDQFIEDTILKSDIEFWDLVQRREPPEMSNTSDCRLRYRTPSIDKMARANFKVSNALEALANCKIKVKSLQSDEEKYKMHIMNHMADAEYLMGMDNELLATWKANKKGVRVFNIK